MEYQQFLSSLSGIATSPCVANTLVLAQDVIVECEWLYITILRHAWHFFSDFMVVEGDTRKTSASRQSKSQNVVSGSQSHCCRWSRTGCMATILTPAISVRVSSCSWNRVAEMTFVQRIRFKFVKQFCKTDDFACGICKCVSVAVSDFWDRSVCVRPRGLQSFSIIF